MRFPEVALPEDDLPLLEMRDVLITKKSEISGIYEPADILTVFEDGPFRMTGRLLRRGDAKSIGK